jgi:hypothetical protein
VVAILAGAGGATYLGYTNLKGRVDRLQAALTTDLQAGQRELEAGKASLLAANSQHDASLVTEAVAHFATARRLFQAAGQAADNSKLLRYLEDVPVVGSLAHSRHLAINGIADMGIAISDADQGLDQAKASLPPIRADLVHAQTAAAQVDVGVVLAGQQATFTKAVNTVATALSGLDEFQRLVPVLEEMLGGNGPRTYLIEQVNPAELRAGGGFIGTYSLVKADQGAISITSSGDAYDLTNPRAAPGQSRFVPQPSPLRDIIPDIPWTFVDSNVFPDFPSNAKAALNFVQPRIATRIDAVISMDYYTVAKMLELTGPLTVPGYGLTVDANNFVPQMIQRELVLDPLHKSILSALAEPLMQRISNLPSDHWSALLTAFNTLASQRHLQAYFINPSVEDEVSRVGWSGTLNPTHEQDSDPEGEALQARSRVCRARLTSIGMSQAAARSS